MQRVHACFYRCKSTNLGICPQTERELFPGANLNPVKANSTERKSYEEPDAAGVLFAGDVLEALNVLA
jgi:hypothetical protein